jgi:hypothetical protein
MSNERKKRTWPWIVALLISLPVVYLASFGPACWIAGRIPWMSQHLLVIYRPLDRAAWDLPDSVSESLDWYGALFLPDDQGLWTGMGNENGDYSPGPHLFRRGWIQRADGTSDYNWDAPANANSDGELLPGAPPPMDAVQAMVKSDPLPPAPALPEDEPEESERIE